VSRRLDFSDRQMRAYLEQLEHEVATRTAESPAPIPAVELSQPALPEFAHLCGRAVLDPTVRFMRVSARIVADKVVEQWIEVRRATETWERFE
jgi:hypothetical protein